MTPPRPDPSAPDRQRHPFILTADMFAAVGFCQRGVKRFRKRYPEGVQLLRGSPR